ncbi:glycosyltransferase family 1 protein [Sphingobium sp. SCG-1]|uniref:glycosyltransferase n=1 Tax=Sphingobium sp. SCG-1 TaxID=2072936 RepID=UPI000CD6C1FB|nr:glycosyltransferase [Sphingobium sp. SCG-1]AUW56880.1 glycosyltransferase family 1 protein [Sphingobium sp. SCG-1]
MLSPFFETLPFRLSQFLIGRRLRKLLVLRQRKRTYSANRSGTDNLQPRLFIDVAVIYKNDAGTGIQRVVRELALALTKEAPTQWAVQFVAADRRRPYHRVSWPDIGRIVEPATIQSRPGDVFIGLDFSLDTVRRYRRQLAQFRKGGGQLWFLMYDLLPVERPGWFSTYNVIRFKAWLEVLAGIADGFFCISDQTAADLKRVLADRFDLLSGFETNTVPMGYSISESLGQKTTAATVTRSVEFDTSVPFFLMVGTLEPRKGHAEIVDGFSGLWKGRGGYRLVIVGRRGWHTEDLCNAIRLHPEHGRNLIWLDNVEDAELARIYEACSGVIIGSHAEGFGLPLIEALGYKKPVLARDIAIFRLHEKLGVRYFPQCSNPSALGTYIQNWAEDVLANRITVLKPVGEWKDAAITIFSILTRAADIRAKSSL